jgi:hypothetical protein
MSFLTVIKAFPFLLLVAYHLVFRNAPGVSSVPYDRPYLLIYLIWISLFSGRKAIMIISSPLFNLLLGPASEIIVETDDGLDKIVHCLGEFLDSHNILNISL